MVVCTPGTEPESMTNQQARPAPAAPETTPPETSRQRPSLWSRWPAWAGYAAAVWSLIYGGLGLYWSLGGGGFPFGRNDPNWEPGMSVLGDLRAEVGGPAIAVLGLVGTIAGIMMVRTRGRGPGRTALLAWGWTLAVALAVVIPDNRVLMIVAYAPVLLVFVFTGVPGDQDLADLVPWSRINLFILVIGGLLWALATLAYQRRSAGVCENCGRGEASAAGWTSSVAARRWGRWAVYVAAIIPATYDATRIAWALGFPVGVTEEFWQWLDTSGLRWAGLFLSAMGVGGAILTLGLIQRWGEVYPRWIWFKSGQRVPPALAIIPASLVSIMVTAAGLMYVRAYIFGSLGDHPDMWATWAPGLLWPVWGVALGVATLAYYLRRRTACRHCGRGQAAGSTVGTTRSDAEPAPEPTESSDARSVTD
jgi:hypothetical protein